MPNLKHLATVSVLALSLSMTLPALAQQQTNDGARPPSEDRGTTQSQGMPQTTGTPDTRENSDGTAAGTNDGTAADAKDGTMKDQARASTGPLTPVTEQKPTQFLADDLIGSSVYNTADESIGVVEDLALNANGSVESVIVGVGGFLGIGNKKVGLPWESVQRDLTGGEMVLRVAATTDELEEMPEFRTAAKIESERAAQQARESTMPATGTGAGTRTQ